MAEHQCAICKRDFGTMEGLQHHKKAKHYESTQPSAFQNFVEKVQLHWKKYAVFLLLIALVSGVGYYVATKPPGLTYPTTSMSGHTETSPSSNILDTPMGELTFRHMLEHAWGEEGAEGGIMITYDCVTYVCEDGLIETLESYVLDGGNVFLSPYENQAARVVITKLDWQMVIEEEDLASIELYL
jgi:hypothetical protein